METNKKTYVLSMIACDEVREFVSEFCAETGLNRKDSLRYMLAIEDCMLHWLYGGCEGAEFVVHVGRYFRTPFVMLELEGPKDDPGEKQEEEFGPYCNNILANLGLEPQFSYVHGRNRVLFRMARKPLNQLAVLGIMLVCALVVGFLGMLLPDNVRQTILEGAIQPLYKTFFSMLTCIAGPMIFLSVAWGIYGIGDVEALGTIGKRLMLRFLRIVFLSACAVTPIFLIIGPGFSDSSGGEGRLSKIVDMVVAIVPTNIVDPFSSGNTLQIIFLSIAVSVALLYLGQRAKGVAEGIDQLNALAGFLMTAVSKLVPFVIFLVVVNMIWSGTIDQAGDMWKLIVAAFASEAAITIVYLLFTCWRQRVGIGVLMKKCLPTLMIALTTASSMAAFDPSVETCEKKFGIDGSLTGFGLPLSIVMLKPICAAYFLVISFFFAGMYNVSCDPIWVVMAIIVSCILAIAMPPVPGGGAAVFTMLFAQLGIPAEALPLALAVEMLCDFFVTAFEQLCRLYTLVNVSSELDMIEMETLRAK